MKRFTLHLHPLSNGYEVCVFDEDNQAIDFMLSRDDFHSLYDALNYIEDLSASSNHKIYDIMYDLPVEVSQNLHNVSSVDGDLSVVF